MWPQIVDGAAKLCAFLAAFSMGKYWGRLFCCIALAVSGVVVTLLRPGEPNEWGKDESGDDWLLSHWLYTCGGVGGWPAGWLESCSCVSKTVSVLTSWPSLHAACDVDISLIYNLQADKALWQIGKPGGEYATLCMRKEVGYTQPQTDPYFRGLLRL